jgi:hypothetical protein
VFSGGIDDLATFGRADCSGYPSAPHRCRDVLPKLLTLRWRVFLVPARFGNVPYAGILCDAFGFER